MFTHAVFVRASEIDDEIGDNPYAVFRWITGTDEDAEDYALTLSEEWVGVNIEVWTVKDGKLDEHVSTTFVTDSYARRQR